MKHTESELIDGETQAERCARGEHAITTPEFNEDGQPTEISKCAHCPAVFDVNGPVN